MASSSSSPPAGPADLSQLSVRELKQVAQSCSVVINGCVEKCDIVALLSAHGIDMQSLAVARAAGAEVAGTAGAVPKVMLVARAAGAAVATVAGPAVAGAADFATHDYPGVAVPICKHTI